MTLAWSPLLRAATDDFARCLDDGDLDAPVPSCPGWTLADLAEHLRFVHLWAAHAVTEGDPKGTVEPVGRAGIASAYSEAAAHLVGVLDTDPATPAWTFGPDQAVSFWQRRQVHETTLHLYDALLSQGREAGWPIDPAVAWDGVDEVATMFYPRQVRLGRTEPLDRTLVVTATDVGRTTSIGEGEPVELTGSARDLLLTLWKRLPATSAAADLLATASLTP